MITSPFNNPNGFDEKKIQRKINANWKKAKAYLTRIDKSKWEDFYNGLQIQNETSNGWNGVKVPEAILREQFNKVCKSILKTEELSISHLTKTLEKENNIDLLDLMFTTRDDKKIYISNTENMCRVLKRHPDFMGRFRYDIFKNTFEIKDRDIWRTQEDHDVIDVQTAVCVAVPPFVKISKDMVRDAIIKVSKENSVDTAVDYILSLKWDNVPRLDNWLINTYGVEDNEYHRSVGSNWLKGLVKRIIKPGCKFDYVLVLEGEQGSKKSTSLSILGDSWHAETTMSTDSKDFFMQFAGKVIIEFSEGETLSRTEVKRMKAIITMQSDRYRMPYERATLDFPRRCVFAMTTNQTEYLKDETGNRRWLPVTVVLPQANIEWLKNNREQLFAEAYHRVSILKETIYEFPKEDMLREQEARMISNPNSDIIVEWYFNNLSIREKERGITVHQVFNEVLHPSGTTKALDKYSEMMISDVLKNTLKLQKKRVMLNGVQMTRWFPEKMSTPSEFQEICVKADLFNNEEPF